jgi:putative membrane protein (TIGR04086 family)
MEGSYLKSYYKAFFSGLLLYIILFSLSLTYETTFLLHRDPETLLRIPSIILYVLELVIPGYISGWLSKDKGTIMGFLLGFLGWSFLFIAFHFYKMADTGVFMMWLHRVILASSVGAVSGAAGQFHKILYKKRHQTIADKFTPEKNV